MRDDSEHEMGTTASRQLRRAGDFRAAARFMIGRGIHPKAGRTTLRLAEVFAARMERSRDGHLPFSVEATARQLGLCRRTVLAHAKYLRELGLLAYVEHGSKTNALRTRHGAAWTAAHGYRRTATIFAAVAPYVWDDAEGRRIDGTGYTARPIGVTEQGRAHAIDTARRVATKAQARSASCTPSLVVPQDHRQMQVVGGKKYTPRKRARNPQKPSLPSSIHPSVSTAECARGIALAEQLQREVWWLNRGCARRLGYVLRPLTTSGWTVQSLAAELLTWGVPGHLRDPAAYVRHELQRRQQHAGLPGPATPAVRDDQVDDTGLRHRAMLRRRQEQSAPVWHRYLNEIRPGLRRRQAQVRANTQARAPQRVDYQPMIRESERAFAQALPTQSWGEDVSARDVYQARARGLPSPAGRAAPEDDRGWLVYLRDQQEAERACAVLRAELENWEAEHVLSAQAQ
ncbi:MULTISPECIES: hypothetical protein [unclassified Streptomyces]|uniref:hypothetical protein n=1 Tax=unclassified Streptomyces TaxID=2593676 RepID=UPI002E1A8B32|nr:MULTISPECIES: hypothetical protein [unclassified Streptomyces]